MTIQEQAPSSSFDMIKWILAAVTLAAAVYANHALVDGSIIVRASVVIVLVAAGLGIGFTTTKGQAGLAFAQDSKIEARKVVWPTRSETIQTTIIIVIAVAFVSLLLYFLDMGLVALINLATVRG